MRIGGGRFSYDHRMTCVAPVRAEAGKQRAKKKDLIATGRRCIESVNDPTAGADEMLGVVANVAAEVAQVIFPSSLFVQAEVIVEMTDPSPQGAFGDPVHIGLVKRTVAVASDKVIGNTAARGAYSRMLTVATCHWLKPGSVVDQTSLLGTMVGQESDKHSWILAAAQLYFEALKDESF
ncbi:hypothetical protein ACFL31_02615 [Candidatus Margulisiibacteriota bacterium]